jgi:hypothetical protein
MRLLAVIALTALLAGCGFYRWEKQNASAADFQQDSAACEQSSQPGHWEECMRSKGWHYANSLW